MTTRAHDTRQRRQILQIAEEGPIQTRQIAQLLGIPMHNAATSIRKCLVLGYLRDTGERGPKGRGTYAITSLGRAYICDPDVQEGPHFDDSALRQCMGML